MSTYTDVIHFEECAPPNTIRLIKSGEFFRAYNRSAWLFHCCIAQYKVMRKFVKSLKCDIYYVGFPESSLENNIGERKHAKTEYGYDIELLPDELPSEGGYETWKATIEPAPSSRADYNSLPLAGAAAEREVLRRLRDFPLESKSMIECAVFVAELRKLLNNV